MDLDEGGWACTQEDWLAEGQAARQTGEWAARQEYGLMGKGMGKQVRGWADRQKEGQKEERKTNREMVWKVEGLHR